MGSFGPQEPMVWLVLITERNGLERRFHCERIDALRRSLCMSSHMVLLGQSGALEERSLDPSSTKRHQTSP